MAEPKLATERGVGVRAVAVAVVGHQPLDAHAMIAEPGHGAPQEPADGVGALAAENLDVGQAGAVVDADMHELPASAARAAGQVATYSMAIAIDPAQLVDVDVNELATIRQLRSYWLAVNEPPPNVPDQ